jgi:hypothetical protein
MDFTLVFNVDFFDLVDFFNLEVEEEFADEVYEYDDEGIAYWFDAENEVWYWYDKESDDWYECEEDAE